jgi:hypothetical protein
VYSYSLAKIPQLSPPPPHLGSYTRALLVREYRRYLFVTPCSQPSKREVQIRHVSYISLFDILFGPGTRDKIVQRRRERVTVRVVLGQAFAIYAIPSRLVTAGAVHLKYVYSPYRSSTKNIYDMMLCICTIIGHVLVCTHAPFSLSDIYDQKFCFRSTSLVKAVGPLQFETFSCGMNNTGDSPVPAVGRAGALPTLPQAKRHKKPDSVRRLGHSSLRTQSSEYGSALLPSPTLH